MGNPYYMVTPDENHWDSRSAYAREKYVFETDLNKSNHSYQ